MHQKLLNEFSQNAASILLNAANFAAVLIDRNNKIVEINSEYAKRFNKSRDQLLGTNVFAEFPEDVKQNRLEFLNTILETGSGLIVTDVREGIWNRLYLQPIFSDKGKIEYIAAFGVDITNELKIENELKKSERLFNSTINSLNDPLHVIDSMYTIVFINSACHTKNLELNIKNSVIGKRLSEAYPFLSIDILEEYDIVFKEKRVMVTEEKIINGNNEYFTNTVKSPVIENDKVVYIVTVVRDITESRKAEQALKESEEKYRAAFLTSPDSININSLDGLYIDINNGFTQLTGFTRDDVIGHFSSEINIWAIPEDREKLVKGLKEKGVVENLETVFRLKNGTLKTGLMSARIININNQPHILSVTRDISERKKMENEIIEAKEKAQESDRLKTAFLQNMSHEIRTPLNGILGFSELLKNPGISKEDINLYTKIISESGVRLMTVVNDILDLSRIETGQVKVSIKTVNINQFLNKVYLFYKPQAIEKNLDFKLYNNQNDNAILASLDEDMVRQVLDNLLSNAFKFTKEGIVEFGCEKKGNHLEFFVKDTGTGISEDYHEKIFDRFQQADSSLSREYGGAGLGLSISKGLVNLMGGNIRVDSKPGTGSVFYFTIRYLPDTGIKSQEIIKNQSVTCHDLKGNTILVAEDDYTNFQFMKHILQECGAKVIHARNGKETLDIISTRQNIDIILMDIKMPEMNGYETTRLIKSIMPDIPVIAQTAFAMTEDREKAMNAGCIDYISKPMKKEELLRILKNHLTKR